MKIIPDKYIDLHFLSFENKTLLEKEKGRCVCFYCKREFDFEEIVDWVEDKNGLTAQCPYCEIDSVLPKSMVTKKDIENLNKYYF